MRMKAIRPINAQKTPDAAHPIRGREGPDMSRHETVLLGMSGGVDSSAAALLLTRQGYRVIGASLILTDSFDPAPARR